MTPAGPALRVRRPPRDRWPALLRGVAEGEAWARVLASGPGGPATVLPWGPATGLDYDREADRIAIATTGGVHRIGRPLVLFALGDGDAVYRLVVLDFEGDVTIVDLAAAAPSYPGPAGRAARPV